MLYHFLGISFINFPLPLNREQTHLAFVFLTPHVLRECFFAPCFSLFAFDFVSWPFWGCASVVLPLYYSSNSNQTQIPLSLCFLSSTKGLWPR